MIHDCIFLNTRLGKCTYRCAYTYVYITIHREELQEQKYYKTFLSGALLIYDYHTRNTRET